MARFDKISPKFFRRMAFLCCACLVLALAILAALRSEGLLCLNHPSTAAYPVRGVDVSAYQGQIDWETLADQGLSFAFIKATEGSSFEDPRFRENWTGARSAGLRVGAYHFFSFDSPGASQAQNFIGAVQGFEGMLPPVVDVELYGAHKKSPPAREHVQAELDALIEALTARYGCRPILYATQSSYRRYLAEGYEDFDIWIRDVYLRPRLPGDRAWTFWQYCDRGLLEGYAGQERFIDLNVFAGSAEEFANFGP